MIMNTRSRKKQVYNFIYLRGKITLKVDKEMKYPDTCIVNQFIL